jgi:putative ABC transport system permease protein
LSERDVQGSPPVAVINERMAKKYFPGVDPIGKRLLIQGILLWKTQLGPEISREVVGVAADERVGRLDARDDDPGVYVTTDQSPQQFQSLVVRGAIDPTLLQAAIRKTILAINRDQTLTNMKTLEQTKIESLGDNRRRSALLGIFAGFALLLSAVGIYGVVSSAVEQRTREIGIRTALGASPRAILALILRGGMGLVAAGLLLGGAGVFGLMRLLSSLLFGVSERDPLTIGAVAAILAAVAFVACLIPARRATRVNPNIALRAD